MEVEVNHQWFEYTGKSTDTEIDDEIIRLYHDFGNNLISWNLSSINEFNKRLMFRLTWVVNGSEETNNID